MTKLTPIQASLKKNEGYVYKKLLDKRKKIKPKYETADLKKTFSKGDATDWSYELYKITEINIDTIPSYRLGSLPEGYDGALLKKTELLMKENDCVKENLNLS